MNIQRAAWLWGQENLFDKGIQVNYANGPFAVSVSWNDGFDSNVFNSVSGLVSYTFQELSDVWPLPPPALSVRSITRATPSWCLTTLANSSIYNLIYTHTSGHADDPAPYFQYTSIAKPTARPPPPLPLAAAGIGSNHWRRRASKVQLHASIQLGGAWRIHQLKRVSQPARVWSGQQCLVVYGDADISEKASSSSAARCPIRVSMVSSRSVSARVAIKATRCAWLAKLA